MPTATELVWSSLQEDIFRFVESGKGSAVIEANAGSAKTTTLVEAASRLDDWTQSVAIAFNKRIQEKLAKDLPPSTPALTLNALGNRAWRAHIGKSAEVDKFKVGTLVREMADDTNPEYRAGVKRLVDLAKTAGIVPRYVKMEGVRGLAEDTEETWQGLIEEYGVSFGWGDKADRAIECGRRVLAESVRVCGERIDFNDQLYLPVIFGADFPQYELIFCDELQDVSKIQFTMVERSLVGKGRFIGFGDEGQQIFRWRGGIDAMKIAKERFKAISLPLSICYRCSRAVVKEAQKWVPGIQAFEGAVEGKVEELEGWTPATFRPTDVILCRNNAPLVKMAFRLIRAGTPAKMLGRDIGTGLTALVKKFKAESLEELRGKLGAYVAKEADKLNPDQLSSLQDKVATVQIFLENARTPADAIAKIELMFSDETGQFLLLSSVHRFKGLEAPRVFILDRHLIGAREPENNIFYVACTRAKTDLFYIQS